MTPEQVKTMCDTLQREGAPAPFPDYRHLTPEQWEFIDGLEGETQDRVCGIVRTLQGRIGRWQMRAMNAERILGDAKREAQLLRST